QWNFTNFSTLEMYQPEDVLVFDVLVYVQKCEDLKVQFEGILKIDFKKIMPFLDVYTKSFSMEPGMAPGYLQLELIDLQTNTELKVKFGLLPLQKFYRYWISVTNFLLLHSNAMKILTLFGSTYRCEQLFSLMKVRKNKTTNRILDENLAHCLKLYSTDVTLEQMFENMKF
ncbi:hypothetical protein A3Q56_08477, partial [Intoshia linei]